MACLVDNPGRPVLFGRATEEEWIWRRRKVAKERDLEERKRGKLWLGCSV